VKVVFQGQAMEVAPAPLREPRMFAEGPNTPQTAALVLGAMEHRVELVVLNSRLTPGERAVQRESIAAIPPAGEPAAVLFTSGTTGTPKAARLARDNLEANARAANEVLEVDGRSRFLCVLPLFHVGGLGILFRCQLAGATVLLHERFASWQWLGVGLGFVGVLLGVPLSLGSGNLVLLGLSLFGLTARHAWLATIAVLLVGTGVAIAPALQIRLMDIAEDAQTLAAALNHSAFNIANAMGAWLGGVAIGAGLGWASTGWVGAVLAVAGLLIFVASLAEERRNARLRAFAN